MRQRRGVRPAAATALPAAAAARGTSPPGNDRAEAELDRVLGKHRRRAARYRYCLQF